MGDWLGLLSWLLTGALVGWGVNLITGTSRDQGGIDNIIVGILGAFLGAFPFALLTGRSTVLDWDIESFAMAVVGAMVLLVMLHLVPRS